MRGDITKVRFAVSVARHPVSVIADGKKMPSLLAPASERDVLRLRVDAIFHQLGNSLQRIALRQRNDGDRVPIVADFQFAAGWFLRCGCHGCLKWFDGSATLDPSYILFFCFHR